MIHWLDKHSQALQALGAIFTVVVALIALIGIKLQIDGQEQVQQSQSAHEIYRGFLALSVDNPDLADSKYCITIKGSPREAS